MGSETISADVGFRKSLKKNIFHIGLLVCISLPIFLVMILDYLNIEGFSAFLNSKFFFEETWKGRMFYLFFIWLLFIESIIDWNKIAGKKPQNRTRILACFAFALIPTIYVLVVNFVPNASQVVIDIGRNVGIYSGGDGAFLLRDWPLSLEYVIFTIFFASAVLLAYGKGAWSFSISFSFLGLIALMYMIDTIYPFGLFNPLQSFALPTAASSAAFLQLLGYQGVKLAYPVLYQVGNQVSLLPELYIVASNGTILAQALIGWSCAGVHSLLLYILIMLMFLKRSGISSFRKSVYFIFGLFGTYFVNILRISSYFIISMNYGQGAALVFHDNYGELYFFVWIFMYVMLIVGIQRFMLAERTQHAVYNLPEKTRSAFQKFGAYSANKIRKLSSYIKTKLKQH